MRLHILGCGSALPTLRHFPSMQMVECRGKLFMVDCGEGAQMQLRRSGLPFAKVGAVFISHLHGDHCFGLIGMISSFGLLGRTAALHIYAPAALGTMLEGQVKLFCRDLSYNIVFHAVDTTRAQVLYDDRSLTISSIPLVHRMPCCGFLFREKPSLPHIRRDVTDSYDIPVSQLANIKAGLGYTLPDGTFLPSERLTTPAAPPRAYAYCSDTRYLPALHEQLSGVTTLYHESTYCDDNLAMAEKYCHSTARQAALVARDAGVGQLILGHYSSRYKDDQVFIDEASPVFPKVKLAQEMAVFEI